MGAIVAVGIGVWLLLRSCAPEPEEAKARLLPREMASYFRLRDARAVIEHCRAKLQAAEYEGIFRGAHGALWAGGGNAWDRTLLAAEALEGIGIEARIVHAPPVRLAYRDGGWHVLRVDDGAAPELVPAAPAGARSLAELETDATADAHRLVPALLVTGAGGTRRIEAAATERLAEWVRAPVTLTAEDDPAGLRYVLRVGAREALAAAVDGAARVELEIAWRHGEATTSWRRELFSKENAPSEIPGRPAARVGDRCAIVVSAGPLVPEVLATRAAMLADPTLTPLADARLSDLVLLGVRYQVASDQETRELAARSGVRVAYREPRISIVASTPDAGSTAPPTRSGGRDGRIPALSLDALTERIDAEGARARGFHTARGLSNDGIETKVVADAGGSPVISASSILSRFRTQDPVVPAKRLEILAAELDRLLTEEPVGTTLAISALPPEVPLSEASAQAPTLRIERSETGLGLHGVEPAGERPDAAPTYRWAGPDARSPLGAEVGPAALLVDRLLVERSARADFRLRVVREPAWSMEPLPLTDGSVLRYRVEHGGKAYGVIVLVSMAGGSPGGMWFTQPEGTTWVELSTREGARVGSIGPLWPDVVSSSAIGPILESYVVPAGGADTGVAVEVEVRVGDVAQRVRGARIALGDGPGPFLQVESGGRWTPAFVVRDADGFPRRRDDERRVHLLGTAPTAETSVPWKRCARLRPIEVEVEGRWRWAHLVETAAGRVAARVLDEPGAPVVRVLADRTRALLPVEARRGPTWEPANLLERRGEERRVRFRDGASEDAVWRPAGDVRTAGGPPSAAAHAVVVPGRSFSLLLAWERGTTRVVLDQVSPVIHGRVVDAETGAPLAGASVSRESWSVRSAADGSFALHLDDPLFPQASFVGSHLTDAHRHPAIRKARRRDLLVLVDASEEAQAPDGAPAGAPGQRRFDGLVTALGALLPRIASPQDTVRVRLFTHGRPEKGATDGGPDAAIRLQGEVRPAVAADRLRDLVPAGPARPAEALAAFLAEAARGGRAEETVLLWLTSGGGLEDADAISQAYTRAGVHVPLHVFGFGIPEGSVASRVLAGLAKVSGGSFRASDPTPPYALARASYRARFLDLGVRVSAPCHGGERLVLPVGDPGVAPRDVALAADCCCRGSPARLLTITRDTLATLAEAKGLSPRARRWIEERVADGSSEVRIPSRRTHVGRVTAYAWFEVETRTGRLVGRTEDGLHGSLADPETWPETTADDLDPSQWNPHASDAFRSAATQQPFTMWFQGITAYTMGSVQAAFDWRDSPGFRSADPEEFKRFVQANALDHAAAWWADVASQAGGQLAENFWSGVCLNFSLQSGAMGLRSDGCARRWAEDLCERMRDAVRSAGEDLTSEAATELLEDRFGEEHAELVQWAAEQGFSDLAEDLRSRWKDGVNQGLPCERLRAPRPR